MTQNYVFDTRYLVQKYRKTKETAFFFFFFLSFFFPVIHHIGPSFPSSSHHTSVVTQTRGHIAASSPCQLRSYPSTVRALQALSSREDFSYFFPRRLASNCAYTPFKLQALSALSISSFFFYFIFFATKINLRISPRRDSNSGTNHHSYQYKQYSGVVINSSIRRKQTIGPF